jgi:hypothetical protein
VSDPFRDGMEAALRRSETLEEENELLREEIARIREQATAIKEGAKDTSPETHVLADQALGVLDQLEALSKRPNKVRIALDGKLSGEMRPLDAVAANDPAAPTYGGSLAIPKPAPEHASSDVIDVPKPKPSTAPLLPVVETPWRVSVGTMLAVGFGMFVLGLSLGTCMH